MPKCWAINCNNKGSRYSTLSFHRFPDNWEMRRKWNLALRLDNSVPSIHSTNGEGESHSKESETHSASNEENLGSFETSDPLSMPIKEEDIHDALNEEVGSVETPFAIPLPLITSIKEEEVSCDESNEDDNCFSLETPVYKSEPAVTPKVKPSCNALYDHNYIFAKLPRNRPQRDKNPFLSKNQLHKCALLNRQKKIYFLSKRSRNIQQTGAVLDNEKDENLPNLRQTVTVLDNGKEKNNFLSKNPLNIPTEAVIGNEKRKKNRSLSINRPNRQQAVSFKDIVKEQNYALTENSLDTYQVETLMKKMKTKQVKLRSLQKKCYKLEQGNARLKKKMVDMKKEMKYLDQNSKYNESRYNILKSDLGKTLFDMYESEKSEYTDELKVFSLTLFFHSPAAYKFIRDSFGKRLPHTNTLKKWCKSVNGSSGFTTEAFDKLLGSKVPTKETPKEV